MNTTQWIGAFAAARNPGLWAVTLWAVVAASSAAAQVTLVQDGQPRATVYLSQEFELDPKVDAVALRAMTAQQRSAHEATRLRAMAVQDLVHHVRLITGATLPVRRVAGAGDVRGPAIVLGDLAVQMGATPAFDTAMDESIRLITRGDVLLIGGEGEASYRHGVYELLRTLGCDWIMPGDDGIVTPRAATLVVPALDVARQPAFEVRAPWYSGGATIVNADDMARFEQWKIRQQQTLRATDHPEFLHGGHMWSSLLAQHRKEIKENPALAAQVRRPDGTLGPGDVQLEPLHPRVLEMSAQYIRDEFKRNAWPSDKKVAISVGPNDGPGYSESPQALAAGAGRFDPLTGGRDQTDVLMQYANTLQALLEPEFPNLRLGWLLYSVHSDYPMLVKPNAKFVGQFADITQSRYHSLLDERSPSRTYYRRVLKLWGDLSRQQGNVLWYYGYNWNLAENLLPYSKMKMWGQDLPYYHGMGIKGHNNEQDKAWSILGPHNYLMARLGWDITLDWRAVLEDYCGKAFGKGGPFMARYYLALIDAQENAGSEAGGYGSAHLIFTDAFVAQAQALLDQAAAAADTPRDREMVADFSQPLQAARHYMALRTALNGCDFLQAQEHYHAMVKHWDAQHARNPDLVSRYGRRYLDWLFKPVVELGLKHSSGEYRIVQRIPDELPMALDPTHAGAELGLASPATPDRHWLRVRTFSSSFAEQGLLFYGSGGVWYRHRFTAPAAGDLGAGQGLGLFVGSVEDEVRVFLNGRYIGRGVGFIAPFVFDLSEHLKPGQENLLALQVIRNSYLNELGRGGILYPCFLFAGPKLAKVAPNNQPLFRVLPGGSTEPLNP